MYSKEQRKNLRWWDLGRPSYHFEIADVRLPLVIFLKVRVGAQGDGELLLEV